MSMHEVYMQRALDLARRGAGKVAPNPMVGCVIVHQGKIISEGWHEQYGGPHAEDKKAKEKIFSVVEGIDEGEHLGDSEEGEEGVVESEGEGESEEAEEGGGGDFDPEAFGESEEF